MIRIVDNIVADWGWIIWNKDGERVEQIQACLCNGLILIMDPDIFFTISDNSTW